MLTFLLALISGNTVPGTAVDFDYRKALSLGWWLQHFADAYNANPLHMVTELILVVVVVWLLFKRERSNSGGKERLTTREEQELIDEWQPEPLVPEQMNLWSRESVHLNCGAKTTATASDGEKEYIHLASHNYLGFAHRNEIKEVAAATIKECAVGSCGPRGFYGTMDIHLNLEKKIGEYFGATCIIYPDYMGCNASVITAFAKKGDLLLIDEGCHFLITQGAMLSRANVIWYKHNDMNHLSTCLQTVQEEDERHNRPLNRRFIVTEGLFHNSGDICNLSEIVKLKEEYKYRLILDDTHGLGGLHSKGTPGFWNIPMSKVDVYVGSMDTALGSTGGFCVGTRQVTDHQRLSAAGYVFTASSPMFQCVAAQKALELLQSEGQVLINQLHVNSKLMRNKLKDRGKRWRVLGNAESPVIHIRLLNVSDKRAEVYMEEITLQCRQKGVLVFPAAYLPQEYGIREKSNPKPSLRICVTAQHTSEQLEAAADVIVDVMCKVMDSNSYVSEESDLDSSVIQ